LRKCVDVWTGKADGVSVGMLHPGLQDMGVGEIIGRFVTEDASTQVAAVRYTALGAKGSHDTYAVLQASTGSETRDLRVEVLSPRDIRRNEKMAILHLGHLTVAPEGRWSVSRLGILPLVRVEQLER
jgi:hypothetical protein